MKDFQKIWLETLSKTGEYLYAADHHDNIFDHDCNPHIGKLNDKLSFFRAEAGFNNPGLYFNKSKTMFTLHVDGGNLGTLNILVKFGQKLWVFVNKRNNDAILRYLRNKVDRNEVVDQDVNDCGQFFVHRRFIIDPWLAAEEIRKFNNYLN